MMQSASRDNSITEVTVSSDVPARKNDTVDFKRSLGLRDSVSVIVGTIIGAGIFIAPKGVLLYTGSVGELSMILIAKF